MFLPQALIGLATPVAAGATGNSLVINCQGLFNGSVGLSSDHAGTLSVQRYVDALGVIPLGPALTDATSPYSVNWADGFASGSIVVSFINSAGAVANLSNITVNLGAGGSQSPSDGNSILLKSGSNFATAFQAANDALRDGGGGTIALQAGGVYTLAANVKLFLDIGSGVSLNGNGAVIYAPNHTNTTALSLESRPATNGFPISGYDTNANNYFQKRASAHNFAIIGPGDGIGVGTTNGIDVNMTALVVNRSPRPTVTNFAVYGFNKGICLRNEGYLCEFTSGIVNNCFNALYLNGGNTSAENQVFRNVTFGNSNFGLVIDTAAENSTAQTTRVYFDTCSFDYNGVQIKLISGNGELRFTGGNIENNGVATYICDLTGTANNVLTLTFRDLILNYTGTPSTGFTNYFGIGNNVQVRIEECWMNNILGSGQTVNGLNYPALANITGATLSGIEVTGTRLFNVPTVAPLVSLSNNNSLLADPLFAQAFLVDEWFIYRLNGTFFAPVSLSDRLTPTSQATPNIVSMQKDTYLSQPCLSITLDANGALGANNRTIGLIIPRRDRRLFGVWQHAISAGSGTYAWTIAPCRVDEASGSQAVAGTAYGYNPRVFNVGTSFASGTATPTTAWTRQAWKGGAFTNDPRMVLPDWASHIFVTLDCSAINNASGKVYFTGLFANIW
jgi:hypothetical protein